jgi:RecA-family ATPase
MSLEEIRMPEGVKDIDELVRAGREVPTPTPLNQPSNEKQELNNRVTTLTLDEIRKRPEPKPCIAKYFPVDSTTAIVAMGGVGKTTWATRLLLDALSADATLEVMIVSSEDGPDDYQSKVFNSLYTEDSQGEAFHPVHAKDIAGRMHVLDLKGQGSKLVAEHDGSYIPSPFTSELLEMIKSQFPKVRVVIFETVSRFAGGETNERLEALVSACDQIAMGINGASVLVHHTGKGQAREKVVDLYSGRGGSALGDNTRSFIVLTRFDREYMQQHPINAPLDDIDAGRAFEVRHVRSSYGPTQEPLYYITRQGCCHGPVLEEVEPLADSDIHRAKVEALEAAESAAVNKIFETIKVKGGKVPKKFFDSNTKDLLGITQKCARELIDELLEVGSLVETSESKGKAKQKILIAGAVN